MAVTLKFPVTFNMSQRFFFARASVTFNMSQFAPKFKFATQSAIIVNCLLVINSNFMARAIYEN